MDHRILITREVTNEKGTREFAAAAILFFQPNDTILLYGGLGSGKTFLIKEFVRLLDSKQQAYSPSFTILNQYTGKYRINHIDLYRIFNVRELDNLGLDDLWDGDYITFIEWPDIIEDRIIWPNFRIHIEVNPVEKSWRRFRLSKYNG